MLTSWGSNRYAEALAVFLAAAVSALTSLLAADELLAQEALREIQAVQSSPSPTSTELVRVGMKYYGHPDIEVCRAAHGLLRKAGDYRHFPDALARLLHLLREKEDEQKALAQVVELYIESMCSTDIRNALGDPIAFTEKAFLNSPSSEIANRFWRAVCSNHAELIATEQAKRKVQEILASPRMGEGFRHLELLGNLTVVLAERADPATPHILDIEESLLPDCPEQAKDRLKLWLRVARTAYRVSTSQTPADALKIAIQSGDPAVEQWGLLYVYDHRIRELVPFIADCVSTCSPMSRPLCRAVIEALQNPETMDRGRPGSRRNPLRALPDESPIEPHVAGDRSKTPTRTGAETGHGVGP
jgi:hypothetical protein